METKAVLKPILFLATVDSHIFYFHLPFMKLLRSWGYEVEVAAGEAGFREHIEKEGFRVYSLPFSRRPFSFCNLLAFYRLYALMKKRKYCMVHTHTPVASFLGRIAAKLARVPVVLYTAHGFHFFRGAPRKAWLLWYTAEKIASFFTDAILVMNQEDFENAQKLGFVPGKTLFLVHGVGVDVEKFGVTSSSPRQELGIETKEVVVTCIAEFTPTKNHDFLLASWKEVVKKRNGVHLLLVGEGELLEKMKERVRWESVPGVHFLGRRSDIPQILAASDIVVLTSKREGLPRALLEGMARGLPLLATDVRGNRELVEDGVNGFLVPLGDVEALSRALEKLIDSPELREKMGRESKKKVEDYSLDRVLGEMEKVYRKFLSGVSVKR